MDPDPDKWCSVNGAKECRELEEAFGVKLTDSIISEDERWGPCSHENDAETEGQGTTRSKKRLHL